MSTSTPYPATPPRLPHSTSSPSVLLSPSLSSQPSVQNMASSPKHSQNFHPYLIQSTSSSLLTRSNSSPSQPISSLSRHRPSRSMSSLAHTAEGGGVVQEEGEEVAGGDGGKKRSVDSPGMGMRRSGTLPSFLNTGGMVKEKEKELNLPINPKLWTPFELAQYLGSTLRSGGPDGTGQVLPAPLVEDIKTWVLRQRVSGRAFLRGNAEGWATSSRPPPFLPLLLTLSRRLRRASIHGRPSSDPLESADSVLMEENSEEEDVSGVRRMAHAFESRDSASDASEDEATPAQLRAQSTGGSDNGAWERWGLKRQNTGGSEGYARRRRNSSMSYKGVSVGSSPDREVVTPSMEEGVQPTKTLAPDSKDGATSIADDEPSPPPPYTSPAPDVDGSSPAGYRTRLLNRESTPLATRERTSNTPTPERPGPSSAGLGFSPPSITDTSKSASTTESSALAQRRPYGGLRRASSSSAPRLPTIHSLRGRPEDEEGYLSASDSPLGSRRVTLRPRQAVGEVFTKSSREVELEQQLSEVLERVKLLESKLEEQGQDARSVVVPESVGAVSPIPRSNPASPVMSYIPEVVLDKLGLGVREDRDGLPRTVGELPAYLFLIGFGVGAVMVRVLLGRGR